MAHDTDLETGPPLEAAQPGDETPERLAEALTRASWRLRRSERAELAPHGLTFAQARALRVLVEHGPMRMVDLAETLEIVPRTATARVDGLEEAGFVQRTPDPDDRRSIRVSATSDGADLISRLAAQRRRSAESLFAPLGPSDRSELLRLLMLVTEAV